MHIKFCCYTKHIFKIDYYVLPTMKAMIFRTKAKMKIKFENAVCILYKRFQILILNATVVKLFRTSQYGLCYCVRYIYIDPILVKLNALLTFQRTDSSKENVTRVMN